MAFFFSVIPKTLYIFMSCNSLWVFFFFSSPVSSWVLTKWPHARGGELWPLQCLRTVAGHCDLPPVFSLLPPFFLFFFFLVLILRLAVPGCCHAAAIRQRKAETRTRPSSSAAASPFHRLSSFVRVSRSCEGFFCLFLSRNIGWDSFTKCTLYVFSNASRKTRALVSVSGSADSLLSVFLFFTSSPLPLPLSCVLESHIIMQCYKSFKDETYQAGKGDWEAAVTPALIACCVLLAFCTATGTLCPVITNAPPPDLGRLNQSQF